MRNHVSWSQLETLSDCGEKYRQRYILKETERTPKGFFIGGGALHTAIEESENTGAWADPESFERGGDIWLFFLAELNRLTLDAGGDDAVEWGGRKSKDFPKGEDRRWWEFNGPAMLRRYSALRRADEAAGLGRPSTEVKVTAPRETGIPVLGYIDQLFPDRVRDFKTGKPGASGPPFQLALYEWSLREGGHEPRSIGEYVFLRAQDAERRVYRVDLDVWVPLVPTLLEQMEGQLERGIFTYSPGRHCTWCDVAARCEVGRRLTGVGDELGGPEATDAQQAAGPRV